MPEQITLSLSGMGPVFTFISQGGIQQGPSGWCSDGEGGVGEPATMGNVFCGECGPEDGLVLRTGGGSGGIFGYTIGIIQQDGSAVLDLMSSGCDSWLYQGYLPVPPWATWTSGSPVSVYCNGELGTPVSVSISRTAVDTTVTISPPANGGGQAATAVVESISNSGAVESVTLTDGGSGYAAEIINRAQPSVAASVSGGSGAVLSVTLSQNGAGQNATWSVASVTVTSGGTGYAGGAVVTFTPEQAAVTASAAFAQVIVDRLEPTVTASATGGSGAALAVTLSQGLDWWSNQVYWYVDSVAVTNGGTGYANGSQVVFTVTDGQASYPAFATITTGVEEPTVSATVYANGTGATITPTITQSGNRWSVSSAAITAAGSGYAQGDYIEFTSSDSVESAGYAIVASVNGSGGITGLTIYSGGSYFRDNGIIEGVSVSSGGSYFKSTGIIQSVQVYDGGSYYKPVPTGQVITDTPTVWFSSSTGFGATATATVDSTLGSPTFGKVTAINVDSGGTGYKPGGDGWLCTISGVGNHLAIRQSPQPIATAVAGDPVPCTDFEDRYTYITERITTAACPSSLVSKSYKFSIKISTDVFATLPSDQDASDGMAFCSRRQNFDSWLNLWSHEHTFFDFGNGDIQCSLSPA
jgi:hypothetical protein